MCYCSSFVLWCVCVCVLFEVGFGWVNWNIAIAQDKKSLDTCHSQLHDEILQWAA